MRSLILILALFGCSPPPAPLASARTQRPAEPDRSTPPPPASPENEEAAPSYSTRELKNDITASEALELILAVREREGYDVIRVAQGDRVSQVVESPTKASAQGKVLIRMDPRQWHAWWDLPREADETAGGMTDITRGLRRVLATHWRDAPCTPKIAATPDASFFAVVEAATAFLDERSSCPREFAFELLDTSGPGKTVSPRELEARPSVGKRVLTLRVSERTPPPPPQPSVREERKVRVGGVVERWSIQWRDTPIPVCTPEDDFVCSCSQFSYGERGEADLIRSRPGSPDEQFSLGAIHQGLHQDLPVLGLNEAALPHWPVEENDFGLRDQPGFGERVRARAATTIMKLGDYDHDGWATEFVLPVGGAGCAAHYYVVVGVSRLEPKLHVFGTVTFPEQPLLLGQRAWQRLRQSRGRTSLVEVECGFRGAEDQVEIDLWTDAHGIHGVRRTYECPRAVGKLLESAAF